MSAKSEKPTPKRLRDARKKGQVIKSEEVTIFAQLCFLLLFLLVQARVLFGSVADMVQDAIEAVNAPFSFALGGWLTRFGDTALRPFVHFAILLAVVTLLSLIGQIGFLVSFQSMKPSFKAMNVVQNVKKIFSMKTLFDLFKACLKISILFYVVGYVLWRHTSTLQMMYSARIDEGLEMLYSMAIMILTCVVVASAFFAGIDYAYRRYDEMKKLKMSKDEVKREYKDSEGNPEVKGRRRSLHRELQTGSLSSRVSSSAVVVRNPTHVAVCIHYNIDTMPLPQVAEKGLGIRAGDIIRLAERARVPIVEDVPLAWQLMTDAHVGDYIPPSLFEPVAALLREVMDIDYDADDDMAEPDAPDDLDVLDEPDGGEVRDVDDLDNRGGAEAFAKNPDARATPLGRDRVADS